MKPIYEPKARAKEYGDLAINIYTGCNHGCIYCYAPNVLHKSKDDFTNVEPRKNIVEEVKKQLVSDGIKDKLIHLCFTCDPYPASIDTTPTRRIIEAIKNSGNHVQILTKGGFRAKRDFDLLGPGDWFGVTITGGWTTQEAEPRAATPYNRLASLSEAKTTGCKTWVSCEPVLVPEAIYSLIAENDEIDLFKIGKLNYAPSEIEWAEFGKKAEALCREYGRNYYIKEDLRKEMEANSETDKN